MASKTDLSKNKFALQDGKVALKVTPSLPAVSWDTNNMDINDMESQKFVGETPYIRTVSSL